MFAYIAELQRFTRIAERQRRGHIPAQAEGPGHPCHDKRGLKARHKMLGVLALLTLTTALHAQTAPCGLTSMTETTPPIYPPIAKVAHLAGPVILMVRFKLDGSVDTTNILSGNPIFRTAATDFVRGWHANPFTGPRECPIVITFQLNDSDNCDIPLEPTVPFERVDWQHVVLHARATILCDPGEMILKRKRSLSHLLISAFLSLVPPLNPLCPAHV